MLEDDDIDRSCDHSEYHMTRTVSTGSESLFVPAEIFPQHEHGVVFVERSLPLPCSHHSDPLAA